MSTKAEAIFAQYKGPNGEVAYHEMSDDHASEVRQLNVKMAHARTRFEQLNDLAGHHDEAAKLSKYMNQPVTLAPQPQAPKEGAKSLGRAVFQAMREGDNPRREGQADWELEVKEFSRHARAGTKAVLGTDDALAGVGAEYPPESVRIGTIVETLYQPHNIAPLIPQVAYGQNAIPYLIETVTTEGAAETAEGAAGTEANIAWAETTEPVRKLTVLQPVTEELLADEGAVRAIIDARLRQFMANREDLQLIHGDGIAPNVEGIINRTGVQNVNYSLTGETAQGQAEAALQASNLVRTAFQTPSAFVMKVATWETIRLAKDSQLNYLFAGPADAAQPRLWGLPVILNENMDDSLLATEVPILTGDFSGAATIFRRQGLTVQVSDSHASTFAAGVMTVRMVERLGLAVWRPAGFATVTRIA
jgi:HK97 family phage major capsid protein